MPHSWHHFAFGTMECDCILEYPISLAIAAKVDDTRRYPTPPKPKKVGPHPPHLKAWAKKHKEVRKDTPSNWWRHAEKEWVVPKGTPDYWKRIDEHHEYDIEAALYEWRTGEDYVQRYESPPSNKPKVESTRFPVLSRIYGETFIFWAYGPPDDPRRKRLAPHEPKRDSDLDEGRRLLKRLEEEVCY